MRTLKAKDIAPFTKILKKLDIKESIKDVFTKKKDGEMALTIVWAIVENYHKAEKEFFEFVADLEEKTAEEIAEIPLADFINILMELFGEKNMPFFKLAAK